LAVGQATERDSTTELNKSLDLSISEETVLTMEELKLFCSTEAWASYGVGFARNYQAGITQTERLLHCPARPRIAHNVRIIVINELGEEEEVLLSDG
jgi:hypothetical protein